MEGIRRALVLCLVHIAWSAIEQAPSVGIPRVRVRSEDFSDIIRMRKNDGDDAVKPAPNDTDYKRWSSHSGYKLLYKLCRNLSPQQ